MPNFNLVHLTDRINIQVTAPFRSYKNEQTDNTSRSSPATSHRSDENAVKFAVDMLRVRPDVFRARGRKRISKTPRDENYDERSLTFPDLVNNNTS